MGRFTSQQLAALAEALVASAPEPMAVVDREFRILAANSSFQGLVAENAVGQSLLSAGGGQWDKPAVRRAFEHEFPEIGRREMMLNAGRVDHLRLTLLAFEDVTERQRHARRQDLLMAERAHRVKNALAVAQSLAFQTQGETVEDFKAAYLGRLKALAVAQGALLETQWQGADLQSVVNQVTLPYGGTTDTDGDARLRTQGPPLTVSPQQVTGFALILNELATNASKYGALSKLSGRVAATWKIASGQLLFEWREEGGPPPCLPAKTGFGAKLIDRIVSAQLNGKMELSFESGGLRCVIRVPVSAS